jgi:hypothetical protein
MHADDTHARAEQHFATLVAALEAGRNDALVRDLETASRFHETTVTPESLVIDRDRPGLARPNAHG